jgi:hypothetical protein
MEPFPIELLRDRKHQLHAYCHLCDRWRLLDLDHMLSQWRGFSYAPSEVQCSACGEFGIVKVRRRLARPLEHAPAPPAVASVAG